MPVLDFDSVQGDFQPHSTKYHQTAYLYGLAPIDTCVFDHQGVPLPSFLIISNGLFLTLMFP